MVNSRVVEMWLKNSYLLIFRKHIFLCPLPGDVNSESFRVKYGQQRNSKPGGACSELLINSGGSKLI